MECSLLRAAQDWEIGTIYNFLACCMLRVLVVLRWIDNMLWTHSGNKKFTLQFMYKVMLCQNNNLFSWKCVWM